jgi:riboflavin biosynthesis pyrimidine reductase
VARFQQLIPPGGECDAAAALAGWRDEPARRPGRPRVALNMIASVDGRVTVDGRSGGLGGPADRELFHALRADSDAVLAGAGTVRTERYGPIIRDAAVREQRLAAGLSAQPLAVIVSRTLHLDATLPLLADADSHVVILGPSAGTLGPSAASIDYVRTDSLADGLLELGQRFGVGLVVCEGGPTVNGALLHAGVIDELFLARAPYLVGGEPGLGIVVTPRATPPIRLELRLLLAHDSELYARYAVPS